MLPTQRLLRLHLAAVALFSLHVAAVLFSSSPPSLLLLVWFLFLYTLLSSCFTTSVNNSVIVSFLLVFFVLLLLLWGPHVSNQQFAINYFCKMLTLQCDPRESAHTHTLNNIYAVYSMWNDKLRNTYIWSHCDCRAIEHWASPRATPSPTLHRHFQPHLQPQPHFPLCWLLASKNISRQLPDKDNSCNNKRSVASAREPCICHSGIE